MNKIRVTKIFNMEVAHALLHHQGKCKDVHGHSYQLHVTVVGNVKETGGQPDTGMVVDFTDLKKIVKKQITDIYDHSLVLYEGMDPVKKEIFGKTNTRVIWLNKEPTAENLLLEFVQKIKSELPSHLKLHSLKLFETVASYAEWYAEDQKG